ncbi:hypothetical protein NL676_012152 [Syzygium grande]|nr:hypothetical protein NL676_012152 [Syzygium grande]
MDRSSRDEKNEWSPATGSAKRAASLPPRRQAPESQAAPFALPRHLWFVRRVCVARSPGVPRKVDPDDPTRLRTRVGSDR